MSLTIVPRAGWQARPPTHRVTMPQPAPRTWLHHTAGSERGTAGMRAIQNMHMRPVSEGGRGLSDIAYSWVVDPFNLDVYEGRGAGVVGGHTKNDNSKSHAICVMGNFETKQVSNGLIVTIAGLVRFGWQQGWWPTPALTGGHRDAPGASTACPGQNLYAAIPAINQLAQGGTTMRPDLLLYARRGLDFDAASAAVNARGDSNTTIVVTLDADLAREAIAANIDVWSVGGGSAGDLQGEEVEVVGVTALVTLEQLADRLASL